MSESEEHEDLAPAEAKRRGPTTSTPRPLAAQAPRARRRRVPRWVQLVALPLIVLGLYVVLRASGPVVLLFITAA